MRLVRFEIELPAGLVEDAREELLARGEPAEEGFRWGYLLGVEGSERQGLPAADRLERRLREELIGPVGETTGWRFELSFLKAAVGHPPCVSEGVHYEGFHLDTHPAITQPAGRELVRVLVNLAPTPRSLRFAAVDRFGLVERGVPVHRGDYQVVDLPAGVEVDVVDIPGATADSVNALCFWASVVPHVGVERPEGHFLASYEAVAPYPAPI